MQLVFPTSGRAEILGRPLGDLAVEAPHRLPAGTPVLLRLPDRRRAARRISRRCSGIAGRERTRRVARLLDEVGIGAERRLQLRKFSKGMLQRVGLAQALLNDPELVIFDEPMSGLDPLGRRDVRALILRLRDRGCTVFFSSHVLSDAEALCSRVAILAKGRLVTAGKLTDMLAFQIRGWEVVAAAVRAAICSPSSRRRRPRSPGSGTTATCSSCRSIRRPTGSSATSPPAGATLLSVNPLRDTLEDFFVKQVTAPELAAHDRGLGGAVVGDTR